jgi:hypothetical protein
VEDLVPTAAHERGTLAPGDDARAGDPCPRRRASARPGAGGREGTESSLPQMGEGGDATGIPRSRYSWWGAGAAAAGRSRVRGRGKRDRERDRDPVS